MRNKWTTEQSWQWWKERPWLMGCNYIPRTASNQLEMWQADSFDPRTISQELAWAANLGFNSLRVFLHDLPWFDDAAGFRARLDRFLGIADRQGIGAMLVFFDSCWHPFPRSGVQREPEPHVHNSTWVQSPGAHVLSDDKRFNRRRAYVRDVIGHFRDDRRVHVWDLWNEPDAAGQLSYAVRDMGAEKARVVARLLPRVFEWARSADPTQPVTAGVRRGDFSWPDQLRDHARIMLEESDVISFHAYQGPAELRSSIKFLKRWNRPMLCTEYMARPIGSTFASDLPVLARHQVGAYHWGFVAGRSQTQYPWDSWRKQYDREPATWFHDVLRPTGQPYRAAEVRTIKRVIAAERKRRASSGRSPTPTKRRINAAG